MTARHLTFFEMLGNFSIGDYFKQGAVEFALGAVHRGLRASTPSDIWITVFGGDEELGLGPDEEAIECWRAIGMPDERIVLLGREDNFWQSGPDRALRALLGALPRPRPRRSAPDSDRPGDDTERFLEFWNLVFMQYELHADGSLHRAAQPRTSTPAWGSSAWRRSSRTSPSVFETDSSGRWSSSARSCPGARYGQDFPTTRALRILADHGRARRLPDGRRRGALERGPRLHPAPDHAPRDPAGPRARHRGALRARAVRARDRGDGRRLPRADGRVADDRALGARRGGGLRPHARAGRAAARPSWSSAREGGEHVVGRRPRTRSGCTTPTASPSR